MVSAAATSQQRQQSAAATRATSQQQQSSRLDREDGRAAPRATTAAATSQQQESSRRRLALANATAALDNIAAAWSVAAERYLSAEYLLQAAENVHFLCQGMAGGVAVPKETEGFFWMSHVASSPSLVVVVMPCKL